MVNKLKAVIKVRKESYYSEEKAWGIVRASIIKVTNKYKIDKDPHRRYSFKGNMAKPIIDGEYYVEAEEEMDPQWGLQFKLKIFANMCVFNNLDEKGKRGILDSIFTKNNNKIVENMYNALEDPFQALMDKDLAALTQVRGCGMKTAALWSNRFINEYAVAKIIVDLHECDLTPGIAKKLLKFYGSTELVVEKVKKNPYALCEIGGIGWKTADMLAQSVDDIKFDDMTRVESYIMYYLEEKAKNGYSYIEPDMLMGALLETIGEDLSDYVITAAIHDLRDKKRLWWNEEKTFIGLRRYYNLEVNIATELLRIRDAESNFFFGNWEQIVKDKEKEQGWNYTDQQISAIKMALEENIICITGGAGTGKSSIVDGILDILSDYTSATCALAGRAASRISEITGEESYTIHRLLEFGNKKGERETWGRNENKPLDQQVIVLDEVSMVGGYLFLRLLKAIKSGSKLILLGDIGQLESIGECKVAADIIESPEIPTIVLDKIHRQAQKSAIITDSVSIRKGAQLIGKDWVGKEVRGELKDLCLDCFSDATNTFYKVMHYFVEEMKHVDSITDLQVIGAMKNRGSASIWNVNTAAQEIYNPPSSKKEEVQVLYMNKNIGILREGDKVINRTNNYHTCGPKGELRPIYNGNIGLIKEIDNKNESITVDFPEAGGEVIIEKDYYPYLELGYAITCHSSQGSQFKRVIVGLDYSSYMMLNREWLYTAITRASEHCTLVAQNTALRKAIWQESVKTKNSHLVQLLDEIAHPAFTF